ncbi:DUF4129 domain-containing protein [Dechloromonas denitrificans]|uniref:DUF4129 domain-containing protein n=1 Tax=Dechloromonas denitrificans TaxID=281362 RepID=UPI0021F671C0|nr:DUF4129 domain-containing protein [Dechloromonas denitrificans]UCV08596.1 DUF4129 domain-containing protein [Dechloromonas denitrificans]
MNPPLTYFSAYLGLFAALSLGVACNAFLDIGYGSFSTEVILWAAVFAWTLRVGWKQQGSPQESGQQQQKIVLILGFVATVLVFMPLWGLPRAGIYLLAVLQAAQNCVTTSRRQLHLGLLVSAVMVMFAASHYRADWTMLFYLAPYVAAVVFTLVSEQINRRAEDLRQVSLGQPTAGGQGMAIAAATTTILLLATTFYLLTPQVTWPQLFWRYGQLSNIGLLGESPGSGGAGQSGGEGASGGAGSDGATDGQNGPGDGQPGAASPSARGWPTPGEMRAAADRPGMPHWQSTTIRQLASLSESLQQSLAPVMENLEALWNAIKEWLQKHRTAAWLSLFALLLLILLGVIALLLREVKVVTWLRTRYDYLRLGLLAQHASGCAGARQYYQAMERLFVIQDTPRPPAANTREYLAAMTQFRPHLQAETSALTRLFEMARYGRATADAGDLEQMRRLYRQLFHKLG